MSNFYSKLKLLIDSSIFQVNNYTNLEKPGVGIADFVKASTTDNKTIAMANV